MAIRNSNLSLPLYLMSTQERKYRQVHAGKKIIARTSVLPFCYVFFLVQEQGYFFNMQISGLKVAWLHSERRGDSKTVLSFVLHPLKAKIFSGQFTL